MGSLQRITALRHVVNPNTAVGFEKMASDIMERRAPFRWYGFKRHIARG